MYTIGVLTGSVRPNRLSRKVAEWVVDSASVYAKEANLDARFQLIDIKEANLPLYDEPNPPKAGNPIHEHTKAWAKKIAPCDGFIFVCPEYNHGIPDPLKAALDFLYFEWNNKACSFVSYGSAGGVRSVEQMRQVVGFLKMADVDAELNFKLSDDFDTDGNFTPRPLAQRFLKEMLDQLLLWTDALAPLR